MGEKGQVTFHFGGIENHLGVKNMNATVISHKNPVSRQSCIILSTESDTLVNTESLSFTVWPVHSGLASATSIIFWRKEPCQAASAWARHPNPYTS